MKFLFVTTISDTTNAFLVPHIKLLTQNGHQVELAFNIVEEVNSDLKEMGCRVHQVEFQRNPLDKRNISAYRKLKTLVKRGKYDIVHTHTPIASACVRLACRNIKGTRVFYTAHGFHFFSGAPLVNWLVYYPIERYLSKYTDTLITINKEDYERAKRAFKAKTINYMPGVGLEIRSFEKKKEVSRSFKTTEIGVPNDAIIAVSIGEINKNKNHETIIRAIAELRDPRIYYVICGKGPLEEYLNELSRTLGIEKQVKFLGYRNDIIEILSVSDIFLFPSLREGLGLAALEAMAAGLPIITSNIHGIKDYSLHGVTGYSYHPRDVQGFAKGIKKLSSDYKLSSEMSAKNLEMVKRFSLDSAIKYLSKIYGL